jgi:small conductance mechanosensitive channel
MNMLIGTVPSGGTNELVKGTLRELGVETYWQKVSPLVTEYGLRVAGALVFLLISMYVAGVAARALRRALERTHVETTLARFLSNVTRVVVIVMAVLTCMSIVGIPITSFAAMLGAGGLAVGLALQGSLSNIAAGAALSITRPFRVGDAVVVAGQRGIVDEIGLFTTILTTIDTRRIIIPNGQIFGTIIENTTHHPVRRVQVVVGVAFSADIDRTRAALLEAVRAAAGRVDDPAPQVILSGLNESAVTWELNLWARGEEMVAAREALIRETKRALDAAGIEVPVPQRIVHLRQSTPESA